MATKAVWLWLLIPCAALAAVAPDPAPPAQDAPPPYTVLEVITVTGEGAFIINAGAYGCPPPAHRVVWTSPTGVQVGCGLPGNDGSWTVIDETGQVHGLVPTRTSL